MQIRWAANLILSLLVSAALTAGCAHTSQRSATYQQPESPYLSLMLARQAEHRADWDRALGLYATLDDPYGWLARARIHFTLNQNKEALELIERLLAEGTYADEARELRTKISARKQHWDQAIADAEILARRHPDNREIRLFLANLKLITSDFKGARTLLETMLDAPEDGVVLYALSKACLGDQDIVCAKKALQELILKEETFAPAYMDLGRLHEMLGQKAAAEESYQRLLEIDPFSREALSALVDLLIPQARYDEARDYVITLMEHHPSEEVLTKLILLDLQAERYDQIIEFLSPEEDLSEELRYYLAVAHAGRGEWEAALAILDTLPVSGEQGCDVVLLKVAVLEDTGQTQQALATLREAWEKFSAENSCKEIGYKLSMALESAGQRTEGLNVALAMLERDPHDPVVLNFVGYVWADQGQHLDEAQAMIEEALRQKPEDGYILDSLAWVLYRRQRSQEAFGYLHRALEYNSDDPTINEHMGDILKSLGRNEEALDYYLKASVLGDDTNSGLMIKIRELLE